MKNLILIIASIGSVNAIASEQICKNHPLKGYERICANVEGQASPTHYMYTLNQFTAILMGSDHNPVAANAPKNALCKAMLGKEFKYVKHTAEVGYKALNAISCITKL